MMRKLLIAGILVLLALPIAFAPVEVKYVSDSEPTPDGKFAIVSVNGIALDAGKKTKFFGADFSFVDLGTAPDKLEIAFKGLDGRNLRLSWVAGDDKTQDKTVNLFDLKPGENKNPKGETFATLDTANNKIVITKLPLGGTGELTDIKSAFGSRLIKMVIAPKKGGVEVSEEKQSFVLGLKAPIEPIDSILEALATLNQKLVDDLKFE